MSYFVFAYCFYFLYLSDKYFCTEKSNCVDFFLYSYILDISGILLYLNMEFLGYVLVIIYIGAIAILFLFMVMMLNVKTYELYVDFLGYCLLLYYILRVIFDISFSCMEIWNVKHWRCWVMLMGLITLVLMHNILC